MQVLGAGIGIFIGAVIYWICSEVAWGISGMPHASKALKPGIDRFWRG